MEINRMLAVAWKEFRQLFVCHLVFYFIALLIVYSMFSNAAHVELRHIQLSLQKIVLYLLPLLAFFYGAGNRVTEASHDLEVFMGLRPIRITNLLMVYYGMGLLAWMIWLLLYLVLQVVFFGADILRPVSGGLMENGAAAVFPLIAYCNQMLIYVLIYTVAFAFGMLAPNFVLCVLFSLGSYFWLLFWIGSEACMNQKMWEWYSGLVYCVLILPVPLIGGLTFYIYKNLQLGKRDSSLWLT